MTLINHVLITTITKVVVAKIQGYNNNQNGYGQGGGFAGNQGNYAGSPQAGNGFNTPKSAPQPATAPR